MLTYFRNDYAEYSLDKGILFITYLNGVSIDLNASIQIVKDRLSLHESQFLPVLCDIRGVKEVNKSARAYLAMEGSTLIKAVAFIVEPPVSEVLSEFYIQTSKPPVPTKAFIDIEEALAFLNSFK
ncbi:DUF7793 family protein [Seonamhaeicola marinus]|uniref:DUF7793 domain-containing protein n=1 Tax=Seonamhaeicola marinus TaxID=1912246 RepID=A0A5D0J2E2_9FLAO|nr:hypothetical protein [Seonamhaeicola marinus]TYA89190.1 hypothetical protein FUA24_03370 [Seonamhaeicola marinus]